MTSVGLGSLGAEVHDPVIGAAVAAVVVGVAVAYGLWSNTSLNPGPRRSAWLYLGFGLMCVVAGDLIHALHAGGPPTQIGAPMIVSTGGDLLAIVGLVSLIHQRLPERSSDSLAEALLSTLGSGIRDPRPRGRPHSAVAAWTPGTGARRAFARHRPSVARVQPGLAHRAASRQLPISHRRPYACLFVTNAGYSTPALGGGTGSSWLLETVALLGALLWGASFLHPSRKVAFEPVPLRSVRPQGCGWRCSWRWGCRARRAQCPNRPGHLQSTAGADHRLDPLAVTVGPVPAAPGVHPRCRRVPGPTRFVDRRVQSSPVRGPAPTRLGASRQDQ